MPARRTSSRPVETTPAQRRDEVVAILAAGLARLIRSSDSPPGAPVEAALKMPTTSPSMPGEKLSESGENGLELPRETRLSVTAG